MEQLLLAFAGHESAVQAEHPSTLYPDVLSQALRRTGRSLALLRMAQSLFHDHVPARRRDRAGWAATPEPSEPYSDALEFGSMADFAAAVDADFAHR